MKRTDKDAEPASLQAFRAAQPSADWDALRTDVAYGDIRQQTLADQGGLCAYCEIDIRDNDPLKSRIEHFHPKSDTRTPKNWALDWPNLLAVCAGGSYRHGTAPHTLEPLAHNLSCDAHKDRLIQQNQLSQDCEGWLINPLHLPDAPSLFDIDKFTGELRPHAAHCADIASWPGNQHADTAALVQHTIWALNLNCYRLCQARLALVRDIEHQKKKLRELKLTPQDSMAQLAQRYLRMRWPQFATTLRACLGAAAEVQLQALQHA